jgi:hypothetical protein
VMRARAAVQNDCWLALSDAPLEQPDPADLPGMRLRQGFRN